MHVSIFTDLLKISHSCRMTLATPLLRGAVLSLQWIVSCKSGPPSVPCFLLTSTPMRMACLSRVVQKVWGKVRGYHIAAGESWSLHALCSCALIFSFFFSALLASSVEERVGLSQVQGRLYLNRVFHISANKMFELLFTDSSFTRRFMNVRKITSKTSYFLQFLKLIYSPSLANETCCVSLVLSDSSFTSWQKDASGNMKRSLNYTITISNPLIGKFSTATENQVCLYKCE